MVNDLWVCGGVISANYRKCTPKRERFRGPRKCTPKRERFRGPRST